MENTGHHDQPKANRTFKASIFEMIFSDKNRLLELYNAVNGTDYKDPDLLKVNTLKNAIYMAVRNDISFVIGSRMSLYEHQSTYSENLTLRFLFYVSDLFSSITRDINLYGRKGVKLPAPRFLIFYNGEEEMEERKILRLSDLYSQREENPALELEAVMLNINQGHNQKLLDDCRTLKDYAEYTARVRKYAKGMELDDAVERAITECIREGILADFLKKNRSEAKKVSIYEYDAEKHIRMEREDAMAEGLEKGIALGTERGRRETLQRQIEKKRRKGLNAAEIAEILEEEEETIKEIMEKMEKEEILV